MKNYLPKGQNDARILWYPYLRGLWHSKILKIMKLITVLMMVVCVHLSAHTPPSSEQLLIRSEEHTSELQSRGHLVCRLLLEKKKYMTINLSMTIKIYCI